MKLGVALGVLNPAFHLEVAVEADRLGFESLWLPEHLVFPVAMSGSPLAGDHPPVPPTRRYSTVLRTCPSWLHAPSR